MGLKELLQKMVNEGGSDLHLTTTSPPMARIHGVLQPLGQADLGREETRTLVLEVVPESLANDLDSSKTEIDFSFEVENLGRFRANVFRQRGQISAVFRFIPSKVPHLRELGMPHAVEMLTRRDAGLILVTGPTGSGKSTTLAAMVDLINRERTDHIITIEDPIEFVHRNHSSIVNQREVGNDTATFEQALRSALRQDPDVVLVGELRDLETIKLALKAAETGHLTLGTLHTSGAAQTINRIIDVFSADQQAQIRTQLSFALAGVISQKLLPRADGKGRIATVEIMISNPAIRNNIRSSNIDAIRQTIETSRAQGMMRMQDHMKMLVDAKIVTLEAAVEAGFEPTDSQPPANGSPSINGGANGNNGQSIQPAEPSRKGGNWREGA